LLAAAAAVPAAILTKKKTEGRYQKEKERKKERKKKGLYPLWLVEVSIHSLSKALLPTLHLSPNTTHILSTHLSNSHK